MTNLAKLAEEAFGWLTWKTRQDKELLEEVCDRVVTKDGCPQWVITLAREAHGDMLPDNWRYIFIYEALQALIEKEGDEESALDYYLSDDEIYTRNLIEWVGSDLQRIGYCDDAFEMNGCPQTSRRAGSLPSSRSSRQRSRRR
ncbi:MAG: hypothetical protein HC841_00170 [Verrucomicrobiae bacterium]|nr:hypothetical protein [Verrucomicrobiae bacterium]